MNSSNLYTINDLKKHINNIILNEFTNKDLIRAITIEFSSKGLNQEKVGGLFNQVVSVDDIDNMELVAFAEASNKFFDDYKKKNNDVEKSNKLKYKKVDIAKYVGEGILIGYKKKKQNGKPPLKTINIKQVLKINPYTFLGRISYGDLVDYIHEGLIRYNKETQRQPTLRKLGTKGGYVRDITLNMKSVKEIANLMYDGKFDENEIIFNIRLSNDKSNPKYKFHNLYEQIFGYLLITPNTFVQEDSEDFTIVEILDGYHRIKGAEMAVAKARKNGIELEGGFDVRIVVKDIEEAKRIVIQTFKRSDTGEEFLESLEINDYSKFIDSVIEYSSILKNNVSNDYMQCMEKKSLTYKTILVKTLQKCTDIDVNSVAVKKIGAKKVAEILDNIILYLSEVYYNNDLQLMKETSSLLDINIFVGYLGVACELYKSKKDDFDIIANKIFDNIDLINNNMHLKDKKCNVEAIYNEFINMLIKGR